MSLPDLPLPPSGLPGEPAPAAAVEAAREPVFEGAEEPVGAEDRQGPPTPEELAREEQEKWRRKAQSVSFAFPGKTMVDVYKEARKIDTAYQHARVEHRWADAYYTLHLYLELCMKRKLHKPTEARYEKEGMRVLANLAKMEARLETARKGILWQLQNAAKLPAVVPEAIRAEVTSSVPAAAVVQATPVPESGAIDAEKARAALDALRLTPAQPFSSLPALAVPVATAAAVGAVVGTAVESSSVPPPLPPKPKRLPGTMSTESSMSDEAITTMTLKRVAGDGSCAFRAIAQGEANGKLDNDQELARARELRALAVRLLRERGGEMMVGTGLTIEQVVLMKDGFPSYESYLEKMAKSEHAGETEFWLLAEELGVRISIFINSDEGLEHMITYGAGDTPPPVCLLWQRGQQSDLGNHYDALIPA